MIPRVIETPHGPARVQHHDAENPWATLVLGHGAGGGFHAPDLQTATTAANRAGVSVVHVEQPYRVAGKKSTPTPQKLDEAWLAVLDVLDIRHPLFLGGRSSGARVACRTAKAAKASGVLCLAFPLVTPRGISRQDELDQVEVPLLIIQGIKDRFGMPSGAVQVRGDHGLKSDQPLIGDTVRTWLTNLPSRTALDL